MANGKKRMLKKTKKNPRPAKQPKTGPYSKAAIKSKQSAAKARSKMRT